MKRYKTGDFIKISECEVHMRKCKAPHWKLSGLGSSSKPQIL